MALSYGGITLTLSTAELDALQEAYMRREMVTEFEGQFSPPYNLGHLPFNYSTPPQVKDLGRLYWPRGASRFGFAHFVVSDRILQLIRPLAYAGGTLNALELVMSDGTREIQTNLYMLPPRPISQIASPGVPGGQLWMLTLVDDRYFWWYRGGQIVVNEGVTSWDALYTAIGSALAVTINNDAVDADYGMPTRRFTSLDQPLPVLLDAVAASVGQQVVRKLDGTVEVQNYVSAKADFDANYESLTNRSFGGRLHTVGSGAVSGDMFALVPETVRVVFPVQYVESGEVSSAYGIQTNLVDLTIPEYPEAVEGFSGAQVLWGDLYALTYASGGGPTNLAALTAYAEQLSTDWYKWQLGGTDVVYGGLAPWDPEGISDSIEILYDSKQFLTRVQRAPWNDRAGGGILPDPGTLAELRGLTFIANTGATSGDPGVGYLLWNAAQGGATGINFDDVTADGVNVAGVFATFSNAGYFRLQQENDKDRWQEWKWTAITDETGFTTFTVALLGKSLGDIQNSQLVLCDFKSGVFRVVNSAGTVETAIELVVADTQNDILADNMDGTNTLNEASATTGGTLTSYIQQIVGPKELLDTTTFSYDSGASALAWTSNVVNVYNSGATAGDGGISVATITAPDNDWNTTLGGGVSVGLVGWGVDVSEASFDDAGGVQASIENDEFSIRWYESSVPVASIYLHGTADVVGTYRSAGVEFSDHYIFALGQPISTGARLQWLRFHGDPSGSGVVEVSEYASRLNGTRSVEVIHWVVNPDANGVNLIELRSTSSDFGGASIFVGSSSCTLDVTGSPGGAAAAIAAGGGAGYNVYDGNGYHIGIGRTGAGPSDVHTAGVLTTDGGDEYASLPIDLGDSGGSVTGITSVVNGGTGLSTITDGGVMVGDGTNPVDTVVLTDGQLLIGSTGNNPTASDVTGDAALAAGGAMTVLSASTSFALSGIISPAQLTGNVNDWNPTGWN